MMGIREPEHDKVHEGDLEIEVGPIHSPSLQRSASETSETTEAAAARPLFAPMRSHQAQMGRGLAVTGALAAVVLALVLSLAPTRDALRGAVFGPTPTATVPVPAGEDELYITLSPAWGAVTLDGRALAHLPIEGVEQPLRLNRGRHMLHWRVTSIIDYSCRLTVPSAAGDTCPIRLGILPDKKGIASAVTVQLSLPMLAPAYRASLLAAIQAAFDVRQSSEIVRPGERYFLPGQGNASAVAQQPLRATLRFVLDAGNTNAACAAIQSGPGTNCMMNGDCRELCTAPWQSPQDMPSGAFQAYIVAHAVWRYATLDGHIIADNQSDLDGSLAFLGNGEIPMPVSITWDGSNWQVSAIISPTSPPSELPNPVCASAEADVMFQTFNPPEIRGSQAVVWFYIPGDPIANGCLAAALPMTTQGTPDTSPQGLSAAFLILHRNGVTLAANEAAHIFWPYLPVADAHEQAIAQKLAQQLPRLAGAGQ